MKEKIADAGLEANAKNMRRIKVIHGELLQRSDLDAIVSFLTEDLTWGGPVNQQIQAITSHKVDEYVLANFPRLQQGDVFSTPAFTLPFNSLIFAVISKWDNNFSGGERFLKLALIKALALAAKLGCKRIGIPAMGKNQDEYPLRKTARIVYNALRDSPIDSFEAIEIICKSPDTYEAYQERFSS